MAHSLSAKKRHRQNVKLRAINRSRRTALNTAMRKFNDELHRGSPDDVNSAFKLFCKAVDHAAAERTIPKNTAARRKSRMAKRLNALAKS